jgi:hypothetical protein
MTREQGNSAETLSTIEFDPNLQRYITKTGDVILGSLGQAESPLLAAINKRLASIKDPEARFGVALGLHPNPRVAEAPRYQILSGEAEIGQGAEDADEFLSLITLSRNDIPKLAIPEEHSESLMALADELQLRGGGPDIYSSQKSAI